MHESWHQPDRAERTRGDAHRRGRGGADSEALRHAASDGYPELAALVALIGERPVYLSQHDDAPLSALIAAMSREAETADHDSVRSVRILGRYRDAWRQITEPDDIAG